MKKLKSKLIVFFLSVFLTSCFFPNDNFHVYFLDDPCIMPYKGYTYVTCDRISLIINHDGSFTTLTIPARFPTDLASIPRWLWPIIAPTRSDLMMAAILHDYLYGAHTGFTRYQIDVIFLQSLLESGAPKFRAYEMYFAVRIFGASHFK